MSRYEQRLAADKAHIRQRVAAIGQVVGEAVDNAVRSLLSGDVSACHAIALADLPINREVRAIDKLCHAFVARHLPSAGHLRFVSSVLQMDVALERIGDYAVTIAREGIGLSEPPPEPIAEAIRVLSDQARGMLADAMRSFTDKDAGLAKKTKPIAKEVGRTYGQMFRAMTEGDVSRSLKDAVALLTVYNKLERVSDQAKNICEETIFELTGETKPPKRYKILFLDARNSMIAPLAEAIARKAFPDSGEYQSAGWNAGDELSPELTEFADSRGLDLTGVTAAALENEREALEHFHVIVCLTTDAARHIPEVPYATILLEWDLPKLADAGDESIPARLDAISKELSSHIRELMVTMRGEEAS